MENTQTEIVSNIDAEAYQNLVDFSSEEYEKRMKKYRVLHVCGLVLKFAFLVLTALFILIPFYWMIVVSFKSDIEFTGPYADKPSLWPVYPTWANYAQVLSKSSSFGIYFLNTIIVSFGTTALVVITSIFSAFAFARLKFKGRDAIFSVLLITMMVPGEMMTITNYMTMSVFNWMNTYQALILPFCVSVFYIFFLRQTFKSIPNELYLASKVDGYGDFAYLFKVMIPIGVSAIVTIIILGLMGTWNAYLWPSLVASGNNYGHTMQLVGNGLMKMFESEFRDYKNLKMAASCVVTAPLFIFFCFFRKIIMRGVSRSGIKG